MRGGEDPARFVFSMKPPILFELAGLTESQCPGGLRAAGNSHLMCVYICIYIIYIYIYIHISQRTQSLGTCTD